MADILSINSGNWDDPLTWAGGVPPGVGDNGVINGEHTVMINVDITCDGLRTDDAIGQFEVDSNRTINANILPGPAGGQPPVTIEVGSLNVVINGNIEAGTTYGVDVQAELNSLTINGNIKGSATDSVYGLLVNQAITTLTITGNVIGGDAPGVGAYGVSIEAACDTVIIDGDVIGGNSEGGGAHGINFISPCSDLQVTGNVTGGEGANNSTGIYADADIDSVSIGGNVAAGAGEGGSTGIYCNGVTIGEFSCGGNVVGALDIAGVNGANLRIGVSMDVSGSVIGGLDDSFGIYLEPMAPGIPVTIGGAESGSGARAFGIFVDDSTAAAAVIVDGDIICGTGQFFPVYGPFQLVRRPSNMISIYDDLDNTIEYRSGSYGIGT